MITQRTRRRQTGTREAFDLRTGNEGAEVRIRAHVERARISSVDRLDYFLRSRASKVVVLALVANTMVAQLLYNSAGQLVLGNQVLLGYLICLGDLLHGRLCPLRGLDDLPVA